VGSSKIKRIAALLLEKAVSKMSVVAESERLYLRTLSLDDAEFFCGLFNNPEVMKYYGFVRDLEKTKDWIRFNFKNYEEHGHAKWVVVRKSDDQPLGHAGLMVMTIDGEKEIEQGYFLDNQFWGQGYATEAAKASLSIGFSKFGYKRIISAINPKNEPSVAVAQRLGMLREKSGRGQAGDFTWDCDVYVLNRD
jgi:[ribosomal protein S5]-alanine N-acetyltransferase